LCFSSRQSVLSSGRNIRGIGLCGVRIVRQHVGYLVAVLPGVILLGIGMTLVVAPLTNAAMSSVPEADTGVASAVSNALSKLAALVAVSILTLVLAHGFNMSLKRSLRQASLPIETREQMFKKQFTST
jgi:putative Mn2+ efflux pump MntP